MRKSHQEVISMGHPTRVKAPMWRGHSSSSKIYASFHFALYVYPATSCPVSTTDNEQFIYLLCYLDRSNIGNAKVGFIHSLCEHCGHIDLLQVLNQEEGNDLLSETKMTNFQFTIALMVFLIAYALFEVPSNYMLKRLKPSNWIAFLMLSWGAITMGLGGVQNFGSVTAVRFLLGVFEAGLFPGLVCKCLLGSRA
jgi:hypothetical protein